MEDELIDTAELARRTGTGATTWAKRRMLGHPYTPPFVKLGRSVRYRWSDVEVWLVGCQRNRTSEAA